MEGMGEIMMPDDCISRLGSLVRRIRWTRPLFARPPIDFI
jgi:hypothetical protein